MTARFAVGVRPVAAAADLRQAMEDVEAKRHKRNPWAAQFVSLATTPFSAEAAERVHGQSDQSNVRSGKGWSRCYLMSALMAHHKFHRAPNLPPSLQTAHSTHSPENVGRGPQEAAAGRGAVEAAAAHVHIRTEAGAGCGCCTISAC